MKEISCSQRNHEIFLKTIDFSLLRDTFLLLSWQNTFCIKKRHGWYSLSLNNLEYFSIIQVTSQCYTQSQAILLRNCLHCFGQPVETTHIKDAIFRHCQVSFWKPKFTIRIRKGSETDELSYNLNGSGAPPIFEVEKWNFETPSWNLKKFQIFLETLISKLCLFSKFGVTSWFTKQITTLVKRKFQGRPQNFMTF